MIGFAGIQGKPAAIGASPYHLPPMGANGNRFLVQCPGSLDSAPCPDELGSIRHEQADYYCNLDLYKKELVNKPGKNEPAIAGTCRARHYSASAWLPAGLYSS